MLFTVLFSVLLVLVATPVYGALIYVPAGVVSRARFSLLVLATSVPTAVAFCAAAGAVSAVVGWLALVLIPGPLYLAVTRR